MLVGRTLKATTDRTRVVLDFLDWLDPGEGLIASTTPEIVVDGAWSEAAPSPVEPPADTTPLTSFSDEPADANTKLIFLFDAGTPGLVYLVSTVVTGGTSGRMQSVEFAIAIQDNS